MKRTMKIPKWIRAPHRAVVDPENASSPRELARTAFSALDLHGRVSVDSIVSLVEGRRGKPISIAISRHLNGTEICGLWLARRGDDLIFHAATDSELHRQQIVCHELSHMILRHDEIDGPGLPGLRLVGEGTAMAFGRSGFQDSYELAAEALADLLTYAIRSSTREPEEFEGVFG